MLFVGWIDNLDIPTNKTTMRDPYMHQDLDGESGAISIDSPLAAS